MVEVCRNRAMDGNMDIIDMIDMIGREDRYDKR
jgi:hypothetical protein